MDELSSVAGWQISEVSGSQFISVTHVLADSCSEGCVDTGTRCSIMEMYLFPLDIGCQGILFSLTDGSMDLHLSAWLLFSHVPLAGCCTYLCTSGSITAVELDVCCFLREREKRGKAQDYGCSALQKLNV